MAIAICHQVCFQSARRWCALWWHIKYSHRDMAATGSQVTVKHNATVFFEARVSSRMHEALLDVES